MRLWTLVRASTDTEFLGHRVGWFRVGRRGPGVWWTEETERFSDRLNVTQPVGRVGRWRVYYLRRLEP